MTGPIVNTEMSSAAGSSTADNAYRTAPDSATPTYSWGGSFAIAASGATDTLHPNAAGQMVKYEMVSRAIKANL